MPRFTEQDEPPREPDQEQHYAIYGNVAMPREFCRPCHRWALVIDGRRACCDHPTDLGTRPTKRMSEAPYIRRQPTEEEKRQILEAQQNCCLYCLRSFRSVVIRKDKPVWLRITWDHVVPFSYSQNNSGYNFAAACQICNGIKADLMFASVEAARVYIQALSEAKEFHGEALKGGSEG